jgi:hypothetical protein
VRDQTAVVKGRVVDEHRQRRGIGQTVRRCSTRQRNAGSSMPLVKQLFRKTTFEINALTLN